VISRALEADPHNAEAYLQRAFLGQSKHSDSTSVARDIDEAYRLAPDEPRYLLAKARFESEQSEREHRPASREWVQRLASIQHRYRREPELFVEWRVVHVAGTAGAVQLLALASIWRNFGQGLIVSFLEAGLIFATLAFFFGPLARALRQTRTASVLLSLGGLVALPTYLALPVLLLV